MLQKPPFYFCFSHPEIDEYCRSKLTVPFSMNRLRRTRVERKKEDRTLSLKAPPPRVRRALRKQMAGALIQHGSGGGGLMGTRLAWHEVGEEWRSN